MIVMSKQYIEPLNCKSKTSDCHTRRVNKERKGRLEDRLKLDANKWENTQDIRRPQGTTQIV